MGLKLQQFFLKIPTLTIGLPRNYCSVQKVIFRPRAKAAAEDAAAADKTGKTEAYAKMQELFGMKRFRAFEVVQKHKTLWTVPRQQFNDNYKICVEYEIRDSVMVKHVNFFAVQNLRERLDRMKTFPHVLNVTFPCVTLGETNFIKLCEKQEALKFLKIFVMTFCRVMEMTPADVYEVITKRPVVMKFDLHEFEKTVDLLLKFGISKAEMKNDWWVFCYSRDTIEEKLNLAKSLDVSHLKTWMVRGKSDIFDNYVRRRTENKSILGDKTVIEYLAKKLNCSTIEAQTLVARHPVLEKKSMKKLDSVIEYLYSYGFKAHHICRVPKILLHSVETTKKRIRELEKLGIKLDSLAVLTKSQKQYLQYYEAVLNCNKSKLIKS